MSDTGTQPTPQSIQEAIANALASAPPGGGGATDLIGVPAGYNPALGKGAEDYVFVPRGGGKKIGEFTPIYHEGDEVVLFGGLAPEALYAIQHEAEQIGLLAKGSYKPGVPDDDTMQAMRNVLGITNRRNSTNTNKGTAWKDTFDWLVDQSKRSGTYGAPKATDIRLSNPLDITRMVNDIAAKRLGRSLTPNESTRIVSAYQTAEQTFQQQAAQGGTVTEPPSLESLTTEQIANDPKLNIEMDTQQMVSTFDTFLGMLKGPV